MVRGPTRDCPDCGEPLPAPGDYCVECGFLDLGDDLGTVNVRDAMLAHPDEFDDPYEDEEVLDWEGTADERARIWDIDLDDEDECDCYPDSTGCDCDGDCPCHDDDD